MPTLRILRISFHYRHLQERTVRIAVGQQPLDLELRRTARSSRLLVATDTKDHLPRGRETNEGRVRVRRPAGKNYHLITIDGAALQLLRDLSVLPRAHNDRVTDAVMEALNTALPEYTFV